MTTILGIETSCDETAAAVVQDGRVMLSNVVASQIDVHAQYGGVYPELASRLHAEAISVVVDQAMQEANTEFSQLDAIAVTRGPGLVGSLMVGVNYAKGLALATQKPLLGIQHIEGHVYSLWLTQPFKEPIFPVLVLIVSGGHTELLLMTAHGVYERLGGTLDDAAGEAFDKVGRLLGLPYPGGPSIEKSAEKGNKNAYHFPRAFYNDNGYDFSFSGLKTAVMREVMISASTKDRSERGGDKVSKLRADVSVPDVSASFQSALIETLVEKTIRAAKAYNVSEILLAGGVSANTVLRAELRSRTDLPVRYPPLNLCTDNGAMIAAAGYYRLQEGLQTPIDFDVIPMWRLSKTPYADV
ncbi:MAG: tRNA (adenosine(37)-N6)-threonylcarbamoyltransferase complex transferase subunit TsaD [Phototrophicaceae bacterium]|jgi:N6-L-threonylcarbamoyladenine synthase